MSAQITHVDPEKTIRKLRARVDRLEKALTEQTAPVQHQPCKGTNCGITNTHQQHAVECIAEHDAACDPQWLYDSCRTPSNLIDMTEAKLRSKNT